MCRHQLADAHFRCVFGEPGLRSRSEECQTYQGATELELGTSHFANTMAAARPNDQKNGRGPGNRAMLGLDTFSNRTAPCRPLGGSRAMNMLRTRLPFARLSLLGLAVTLALG